MAGDVGVLVKALDLLEALARGGAMSVAEVTGASGVNRAASYRILTTLERRGYVLRTHDEVRRYLLGPHCGRWCGVRRRSETCSSRRDHNCAVCGRSSARR